MAFRSIFKSGVLYTLGRLLPQLVAFALLPVYSKYLRPDEFAILAICQTVSALALAVFSFALDRSVYRLYWDYVKTTELKTYLGTVQLGVLVVATLFLLISLLGLSLMELSSELRYSVTLSLAVAYIQSLGVVSLVLLQVLEKPAIFVFQNILLFVVQAALTLYVLIALGGGVIGVVAAQFVANLLALPILMINVKSYFKLAFSVGIFRDAVRYSMPLLPVLVGGWALTMSDRLLLERNVDLLTLGVYAMAVRLVAGYVMAANSLFQAYNPVYNKTRCGCKVGGRARLGDCNAFIAYALAFGATVFMLCAPSVVSRFMDPLYYDALEYVPGLVVGAFFYAASGFVNLDLYFLKRTKVVMVSQVLVAGIHVTVILCLVGALSVFAAIVASFTSAVLLILIRSGVLKKGERTDVPWLKAGTLVLGSAIFSFMYVNGMPNGIYGLLAGGLLGASLLVRSGFICLKLSFD